MQLTSPSSLLWNMALMAGCFGVLGAKLFHIIDYWDEFVRDPAGMFFSGLRAHGLRRHPVGGPRDPAGTPVTKGLNGAHLADSVAPGLMLAYGIGRIGCYLSGDGDWGVCSSLANKPGWVPGWLWSETFPRNMLGGVDPVRYNAVERGAECALANPTGVYPDDALRVRHGGRPGRRPVGAAQEPVQGRLADLALRRVRGRRAVRDRDHPRQPRRRALGLPQSQIISVGFIVAGLVGLALTTRRVRRATEPVAVAT